MMDNNQIYLTIGQIQAFISRLLSHYPADIIVAR